MTSINEIRNQELIYAVGTKDKSQNTQRINLNEYQPDEFIRSKDASSDGKFTFKEALKNFGKGLISPIKTMIQHPIATIATLGAITAACAAVPVLAPVIGLGFGALSVLQLGKGVIKTTKDYKNGNYDNAEKGFENIGAGFLNTALSVLGLKSTAKVVTEAKFMNKNNLSVLTKAQKAEIAESTQGGLLNALKENLSLFTTQEGRNAALAQLKPSLMKERFLSFFKFSKRPVEEKVKVRKSPEEFAKTPEGIRRANLTTEQMNTEIQTKFDAVFEELGISKEQRPTLRIKNDINTHGGCYRHNEHVIEINPEAYKTGIFELDDVIMHEATHCKEAMLRAGIPQEQVDKIVIEELSNRIINGESEKIIQSGTFMGATMMEPPKMPPKMRGEFLQFAKDNLYTRSNYHIGINGKDGILYSLHKYNTNKSLLNNNYTDAGRKVEILKEIQELEPELEPILSKLKTMIDRNPDFNAQFKTPEEALEVLCNYTESHNTRFRTFTNTKIGGKAYSGKPLTAEQVKHAEQSLRDNITTIEGNGRVSGFNGIFATGKSFNQYQFSPEEVLAQQKGNSWLIKNLQARLTELKSKPNYDVQEEQLILNLINKAQKTIEYKTKGLEYYKLYTEMINNPNKQELINAVKQLEQELNVLKQAVTEADMIEITKLVEKYARSDYASVKIPLNMTALLEEYRNKTV